MPRPAATNQQVSELFKAESGRVLATLIREETHLTREAVFLGRLFAELIPEAEVFGLLGLMLFHESRSSTRVDADGDLVPLEKQDRSRWDSGLIDEGTRLVQKAFLSGWPSRNPSNGTSPDESRR